MKYHKPSLRTMAFTFGPGDDPACEAHGVQANCQTGGYYL